MFRVFLVLIFVGFLLIFTATALITLTPNTQSTTSVGGVILIGPIPIVFGYGRLAPQLSELAIILTIIAIILFLSPFFINRKRYQALH
ncbi:hypothetical protein B9Q04_16580 [Candidatus Marsarchaeota G2 archaeon BE_D]|uniref:TIGR00304 family protein n=1 Tax=Candidatus Marsarchaeota G2 archaeon BE_D TaxID=1978158 RepID=A0A2R6C6H8_9ARCH|nr:MAG: hypothetical protein B9Q04_16580 [Candidatus Marsarchaeota G2 archaeon BE_D]